MVARMLPMKVRSKRALGDHFMSATHAREVRDRDAEYLGFPEAGEHEGAVPRLRRGTHPRVLRALGIDPSRTLTKREVYELLGGMMADGSPIARSRHGRRYTTRGGGARRDDPQAHHRTDTLAFVMSPDLSWPIAMENSETPAGRAAVYAVIDGAMNDTMQIAADRMGHTRRGRGGRLGHEPGEWTWIEFDQHTSQPTAEGKVSPNFHRHAAGIPVVVTEQGHVGAIDTTLYRGLTLGDVLNRRLHERGTEAGIEVRMVDGKAQVAAVPRGLVDLMSHRAREAERHAMDYARRAGADWDAMHPAEQAGRVRKSVVPSRAGRHDGMAQPQEWRVTFDAFHFHRQDVVRPAHAVPSVGHVLGAEASELQQWQALADDTRRTGILIDVQQQQAEAKGQQPPSFVHRLAENRVVAAVVRAVEAARPALARWQDLARRTAETGRMIAGAAPAIGRWFRERRERKELEFAVRIAELKVQGVQLQGLVERTRETGRMIDRATESGALPRAFRAMAEAPQVAAVAKAFGIEAAPPRPVVTPRREAMNAPAPRPRFRTEISEHDARAQLVEALARNGFKRHELGKLEFNEGKPQYFPVEGNRGTEKSGMVKAWYSRDTGANAGIWNWRKGGFQETWVANGKSVPISPSEAARIEAREAERKAAREAAEAAERKAAAAKASRLWTRAVPATAAHPYLAAKKLEPVDGLRVSRDALLIPLRKAGSKAVVNVERVYLDKQGEFQKRPVEHAEKTGTFFTAGRWVPGQPAIVTEGIANALSIHHATGLAVIRAGDSGNLLAVAKAVREQVGAEVPMVIAGDNDEHLTRRQGERRLDNVGVKKAHEAATAVDGLVWHPESMPENLLRDRGTDWDDVRAKHGIGGLRDAWDKWAETKGFMLARDDWDRMADRGAALSPRDGAAQSEGQGQRL
jgi:putative DNA primase/helicase